MLQLLSSDTVSLASGLAAHETDDKRSLTRLTDTRSPGSEAQPAPAAPPGTTGPVGAAQPGLESWPAPVSRRYSSTHGVQVYTG